MLLLWEFIILSVDCFESWLYRVNEIFLIYALCQVDSVDYSTMYWSVDL